MTLVLCLAPLFNISALLMLLVYIYSILGVHLFTFTRHNAALTETNNFDSLPSASLLLFQCLTGNGWGTLMTSAAITEDSGLCTEEEGNCGTSFAIPYFVSFQIVGSFVFLNLVVAVMIESFMELGVEPDYTQGVVDAWHKLTLDPRVTAYVHALRVAGHADAKLENIDTVAKERLRDSHEWNVTVALDAVGVSVASHAPNIVGDPDFGPDIWTIRTAKLKELLLNIPPPIGLKGAVASYSDAAKLCFHLHLRHVNGRVALKDALPALLKAKLTGGDVDHSSGGRGVASDNTAERDGDEDDTGKSMALEAIRARLKERKERLELSRIDRIWHQTVSTKRRQAVTKTTKSIVAKKRVEPGIPEHAWESVESGVFFPVAPMKKMWDSLVMILIIYSVIMVPYRVCFEAEAIGGTWLFEVGVSLAFCADLFVTFNSAFLQGDRWIIDRRDIANNYLQGWFTIDFLASIPVELITLMFDASSAGVDASAMSQLRILRGLRMVRMLRLLKLLKLDEYIAHLETELKVRTISACVHVGAHAPLLLARASSPPPPPSPTSTRLAVLLQVNLKVLKIVKMVASLLFLMHLLGCFWFYIALTGGYESTWISNYDGGSGLDKPSSTQYLYSVCTHALLGPIF